MKQFVQDHAKFILASILCGVLLILGGVAVWTTIQPPEVSAPITVAPVEEANTASLMLGLGDTLLSLVQNESPVAAFAYLDEVYNSDPAIAENCHGLVHIIGHAAYTKYGFTEATTYANDACGSGYMHGLVEEYIPTLNDMATELPNVCQLNDGRCFHGLGHGLMTYTYENIPQALEWCDHLSQPDQQVQCGEGVFMEYFGADTEEDPKTTIDISKPYQICEEGWAPMYTATCYFYAPRFYHKVYRTVDVGVFNWCANVPKAWRYDCWRGIGSMAMKYTIQNPEWVKEYCTLAPDEYQVACVRGMIGYYIVHFASVEPAAALCVTLPAQFQNDCQDVVRSSRKYYPSFIHPVVTQR